MCSAYQWPHLTFLSTEYTLQSHVIVRGAAVYYVVVIFCSAFLLNWFCRRAGLWIDNWVWVWQLCGQTRDYIQTLCISFYFSTALQLSAFPPELSINLPLIKNLFCYLRSAFFFLLTPSLLSRLCVTHYRRMRMERKKERLRKKGKEKWKEKRWHSPVEEKNE